MMPGTDLTACLESPYVAKDPSVQQLVAEDLKLAQEFLSAATEKLNNPADPGDLTLLAYRSMYGSAKALVHHAGYRVSNFRCLVTTLDQWFVRPKKLDKDLVHQLIAAQKLAGNPEDLWKAAQSFLEKAREIIK